MSRVTKLVSVRARAGSQPTYPVISHHPGVAEGGRRRVGAWAREENRVGWGHPEGREKR